MSSPRQIVNRGRIDRSPDLSALLWMAFTKGFTTALPAGVLPDNQAITLAYDAWVDGLTVAQQHHVERLTRTVVEGA